MGLLIDETRNTPDTTTASKTTNHELCDTWMWVTMTMNVVAHALTLDVITKNLAMMLSSTLSETLSTFSMARHCWYKVAERVECGVVELSRGCSPRNYECDERSDCMRWIKYTIEKGPKIRGIVSTAGQLPAASQWMWLLCSHGGARQRFLSLKTTALRGRRPFVLSLKYPPVPMTPPYGYMVWPGYAKLGTVPVPMEPVCQAPRVYLYPF